MNFIFLGGEVTCPKSLDCVQVWKKQDIAFSQETQLLSPKEAQLGMSLHFIKQVPFILSSTLLSLREKHCNPHFLGTSKLPPFLLGRAWK